MLIIKKKICVMIDVHKYTNMRICKWMNFFALKVEHESIKRHALSNLITQVYCCENKCQSGLGHVVQ